MKSHKIGAGIAVAGVALASVWAGEANDGNAWPITIIGLSAMIIATFMLVTRKTESE